MFLVFLPDILLSAKLIEIQKLSYSSGSGGTESLISPTIDLESPCRMGFRDPWQRHNGSSRLNPLDLFRLTHSPREIFAERLGGRDADKGSPFAEKEILDPVVATPKSRGLSQLRPRECALSALCCPMTAELRIPQAGCWGRSQSRDARRRVVIYLARNFRYFPGHARLLRDKRRVINTGRRPE